MCSRASLVIAQAARRFSRCSAPGGRSRGPIPPPTRGRPPAATAAVDTPAHAQRRERDHLVDGNDRHCTGSSCGSARPREGYVHPRRAVHGHGLPGRPPPRRRAQRRVRRGCGVRPPAGTGTPRRPVPTGPLELGHRAVDVLEGAAATPSRRSGAWPQISSTPSRCRPARSRRRTLLSLNVGCRWQAAVDDLDVDALASMSASRRSIFRGPAAAAADQRRGDGDSAAGSLLRRVELAVDLRHPAPPDRPHRATGFCSARRVHAVGSSDTWASASITRCDTIVIFPDRLTAAMGALGILRGPPGAPRHPPAAGRAAVPAAVAPCPRCAARGWDNWRRYSVAPAFWPSWPSSGGSGSTSARRTVARAAAWRPRRRPRGAGPRLRAGPFLPTVRPAPVSTGGVGWRSGTSPARAGGRVGGRSRCVVRAGRRAAGSALRLGVVSVRFSRRGGLAHRRSRRRPLVVSTGRRRGRADDRRRRDQDVAEVRLDGARRPPSGGWSRNAADELPPSSWPPSAWRGAWCVDTAAATPRCGAVRPALGQFHGVKHRCADMLLSSNRPGRRRGTAPGRGGGGELAASVAVPSALRLPALRQGRIQFPRGRSASPGSTRPPVP